MKVSAPPHQYSGAVASLVFRPGFVSDYFIVALNGEPYRLPDKGADVCLALRGRVPSRYAPDGINADFGADSDEEGVVTVRRFSLWDWDPGEGGALQFEGYISEPESMHAQGSLAFGSLSTPPGMLAVLSYEGLDPELRRELAARALPPLGTIRFW